MNNISTARFPALSQHSQLQLVLNLNPSTFLSPQWNKSLRAFARVTPVRSTTNCLLPFTKFITRNGSLLSIQKVFYYNGGLYCYSIQTIETVLSTRLSQIVLLEWSNHHLICMVNHRICFSARRWSRKYSSTTLQQTITLHFTPGRWHNLGWQTAFRLQVVKKL